MKATLPLLAFLLVSSAIVLSMAFASGRGGRKGRGETNGPRYSKSGYDITPLPTEKVTDLAEHLSPEERNIVIDKGTEPANTGKLLSNKDKGVYACRLCGLPLFDSESKFDSGSGWPSFYRELDEAHVEEISDRSLGMLRTEILCTRCNGHLGHVFNDGPAPTGMRYCVNSASLKFIPEGQDPPPASRPAKTETAYFAGGCFWGIEHRLQEVPGVIDAVSGYQGGSVDNPTYKQVCTGTTGHAETVRVEYDANRVTYEELLDAFFKIHDPTQMNRQGVDVGTQYRSAIYAANDAQLATARKFIEEQAKTERFKDRKIVTEVRKADKFYAAETYHQNYYEKNGGSCPLPTH